MKGLVVSAEWSPKPGYVVSEFERTTGKAITGNSIWKNPRLEVKEVPDPTPGPKDVVLKVRACGVCGSDVHFYETDNEGYMLYPGLTKFPCVIGHEFSGEVVAVGKEVKDLKIGDMVTAEEMIWCGECVPCRNGYPNQCLNLEEIGFTINGAFADYILIGAKYCWKIDEIAERYGDREKAFEAGALVEPTSVAYNGMFVRAEGFKPGGYVVVFGAGPIGLASIALAKASGASKIIAFEISNKRRELAKLVGAEYVYNPTEVDPVEVILDITKGAGADMLVESAGAPTKTIPAMEKTLAIGGKIVQIGRAAERVPVYLEYFQTHAGQIFGAQGHSGYGTFQNVIRLMASGRIDMTQIITSKFSLSDAVSAIKKTSQREDGKVMVRM
ncbi:alcohol dehydrogenase catalytic domain-containing protein [bacterium]|nr:alcohol dehydrogenase catalytic domain-containing protein [bacterium]